MDNMGPNIKIFASLVGGGLTALLGGWDVALKVLVILAVLDYTSGVLAAWYTRKLSSEIGSKGIAKKIMMFIVVAAAFWVDQLTNQNVLRSMAIVWYCINEFISITENAAKAELRVPPTLAQRLKVMQDNSTKDDQEGK